MTMKPAGPGSTKGNRAYGGTLVEAVLAMALGSLILVTMFSLYYVSAASAAKEESRSAAVQEGRIASMRLVRDLRLVGLLALEDEDGDSNDIDRDVPNIEWSNGVLEDIEYASSYYIVFTADLDNDSISETVAYYVEGFSGIPGTVLIQDRWEWDRDSVEWGLIQHRAAVPHVDYMLLRYYDREGSEIPQEGAIPSGGYVLTVGERMRVTTVEVTLVMRSASIENRAGHDYVYLPDGQLFHDDYHREVYRFTVRGRNLSLEAS
jgi:hypothetical protein